MFRPTVVRASRPSTRTLAAAALGAALVTALVVFAGCGSPPVAGASAGPSNSSVKLPEVTITAHDFAFDLPATIPSGLVSLTFVNAGDDVHQVQFFRLLPGVTADQFIAALDAGGPASTRTLGVPTGGADETSPGLTTKVINVFPAGNYVAACLVVGPDGMPHYKMGMVGSVTAAATSASVDPSTALADDGTIGLAGMTVTIPVNLSKPGLRTFKVTNAGPGVHAMDILQLAPGKTAQDMVTFLTTHSGPPPFTLLGGLGGITPGSDGWLVTNLRPGNYVAACLVVDPVSHLPHAANGMYASFTVPAD